MRMAGTALLGTNLMDFTGVAGAGIEGRGLEARTGHEAMGKVAGYGLQSIGQVAAAEELASAQAAVGRAEGNAAMFSGAMDGLSSFASAGIKKWGQGPQQLQSWDDMPAGGLSGPAAGVPDANGWGTSTQNAYYGTGTQKYGAFQPGSYTDYNPRPWP